MFVPNRCPRCKKADGWHEKGSIFRGFRIGKFIRFSPFVGSYRKQDVTYCCDYCGYEGTYDNHAETLGGRRRL